MSQQTENLKDLVNSTVNEALTKRKEQVRAKKGDQYSDGSGSNKNAATAAKNLAATTFFEKKIEDFEQKFTEKEREIENLKNDVDRMANLDKQRIDELEKAKKESLDKYQ